MHESCIDWNGLGRETLGLDRDDGLLMAWHECGWEDDHWMDHSSYRGILLSGGFRWLVT